MDTVAESEAKSILKPWSLGLVVKSKVRGSPVIAVTPSEHLTLQSGRPGENTRSLSQDLGDSFGKAGTQRLQGTGVMSAVWFPDGDDYMFNAPMVTAGETVLLYKFGDNDQLFWRTLYSEPTIRRNDWIIFGAGNLRSGNAPIGTDSMYYMEIDTNGEKVLRLKTSRSDGESFVYEILLDAKNNQVTIQDDIGNMLQIDSDESNVKLVDSAGATFESRNGHPRIFGPKGFEVESPSNVIKGPLVCEDAVTMKSNITLEAGMEQTNSSGGGGSVSFQSPVEMSETLTVNGFATFNGGHTQD